MTISIQILQTTLLKPSDKDSSELPLNSSPEIEKGTLEVDKINSWGNHYRVEIKGKEGYLFASHCKVNQTVLPYFNKEAKMTSIVKACDSFGLTLSTQKAYVLATIKHETGNTFLPIEEYLGRQQAKKLGYDGGEAFYGRGLIQITHKYNYLKYSQLLGIDLVANPQLACQPDIALYIAIHGFKTGAFTGKKLEGCINSQSTDYVNARRVINGLDKADLIASYAVKFEAEVKTNFAGVKSNLNSSHNVMGYKGIDPSKVKLVNQRDNHADRDRDGKDDSFQTCNVHAVKMAIFALTGKDVSIAELDSAVIKMRDSRYSHANLVTLMAKYGVKSVFSTSTTIETIQKHFDKGLPIISSGKLTRGGHIVFVAGYEQGKGYLVYDPYGEPFGKPGAWKYKDVRKPYYLSDASFKNSGMNGIGASGHWVHLLSA